MNRLKARQNKGESSDNGALCRNEILHSEKENLSMNEQIMWKRIDALRDACPNGGMCDYEELTCSHCDEAVELHEQILLSVESRLS
jgi:hypothetical protein